jgi:hypothetical protein
MDLGYKNMAKSFIPFQAVVALVLALVATERTCVAAPDPLSTKVSNAAFMETIKSALQKAL